MCPASRSAFSYSGFASLNTSALLEMLDRRVWTDCGILLVMMEAWLDSTWTYKCVFPGLEYGLVSFFFRSKVTSKKSTTVEFALAVICKPICLNFFAEFLFDVFGCPGWFVDNR